MHPYQVLPVTSAGSRNHVPCCGDDLGTSWLLSCQFLLSSRTFPMNRQVVSHHLELSNHADGTPPPRPGSSHSGLARSHCTRRAPTPTGSGHRQFNRNLGKADGQPHRAVPCTAAQTHGRPIINMSIPSSVKWDLSSVCLFWEGTG